MNVLVFGLLVALVGMAIVFVGLISLVVVISLQSAAVKGMNKKDKKAATPVEKAKPAPVPAAAPAPVAAPAAEDGDEIAAVIAAAILACEGDGAKLRVRSIRRVGANAPAWSLAGRSERV